MLSEEDRAMATVDVHKKLREDCTSGSRDVDRQTERHTDRQMG